MSIFTTIGKAIQNAVIIPTANLIGSGLNKIGVGYTKQTQQAFNNPIGKVYTNLLGASAVGAAVGLIASNPSAAVKILPKTSSGGVSIIKTTALGAAAIVGTNVFATSPAAAEKAVQLPGKLASSLSNQGVNIGDFIQNPSATSALNILKENPGLAAAEAVALFTAAGVAATPAILSALNTRATSKNTQALQTPQNIQIIPDKSERQVPLENLYAQAQANELSKQTALMKQQNEILSQSKEKQLEAMGVYPEKKKKKSKKKVTKKKKAKRKPSKRKKTTKKKGAKKKKSIKRRKSKR